MNAYHTYTAPMSLINDLIDRHVTEWPVGSTYKAEVRGLSEEMHVEYYSSRNELESAITAYAVTSRKTSTPISIGVYEWDMYPVFKERFTFKGK